MKFVSGVNSTAILVILSCRLETSQAGRADRTAAREEAGMAQAAGGSGAWLAALAALVAVLCSIMVT